MADPVVLGVTEASRNFADCISQVRYQGVTFLLLKGGTPVAKIVPVDAKAEGPSKVRLTAREFADWQRTMNGPTQA